MRSPPSMRTASRYVFRAELMSWQGVSALAYLVKDLVEKGELGTRYWLLIPKGPYGYSMRCLADEDRRLPQKVEPHRWRSPGRPTTRRLSKIVAAKSEGKVDFIVTCLLGQPLVEFMKQAHDAGLIGADFPVVDLVLQFNI